RAGAGPPRDSADTGRSAKARPGTEAPGQPAGRSARPASPGKPASPHLRVDRSRSGNSTHSDRPGNAALPEEGEEMRLKPAKRRQTLAQGVGSCGMNSPASSNRRYSPPREEGNTPRPSSARPGMLFAILALMLWGATAFAQDPPAGVLGEIGIDQKLNSPI